MTYIFMYNIIFIFNLFIKKNLAAPIFSTIGFSKLCMQAAISIAPRIYAWIVIFIPILTAKQPCQRKRFRGGELVYLIDLYDVRQFMIDKCDRHFEISEKYTTSVLSNLSCNNPTTIEFDESKQFSICN
jgi:hypothetical protein